MQMLALPWLRPLKPYGPLLLRIGVGVVMALHGWTKWTGGAEGWLSGGMVTDIGLPAPQLFAWLVLIVELVGGILIILGLTTRFWAIGVAIVLIVALVTVKGFGFIEDGQVWAGSKDWALLFGALALAAMGGGALSLDRMLGIDTNDDLA